MGKDLPKKGIQNWPIMERPRKRIFRDGPQSLSDSELLAIVLRTGRANATAVQVSMELLERINGLTGLSNRGFEELCSISGIGPAKAAQIQAAVELGKRVLSMPLTSGIRIGASCDLFEHYYPLLRDLRYEVFKVILLDTKHRIIRDFTASQGSLTLSIVHPREVFNLAVKESAAAVIFIHNHPSGDPIPSDEDRNLTQRLAEAGKILGIQVLDHLIIGDGRYVSFADQGWMSY